MSAGAVDAEQDAVGGPAPARLGLPTVHAGAVRNGAAVYDVCVCACVCVSLVDI